MKDVDHYRKLFIACLYTRYWGFNNTGCDLIIVSEDSDLDMDSSDLFCDEYTLLEACMEGDIEAVQNILDENPTDDELNERDPSGKTGLSHACVAGIEPIVEMLSEMQDVDVNVGDKEGNTPLIFAAQAGHKEIVRILLHDFRKIRVDGRSKAGFTALMKAALQGRTACAKLLLYAGANPKLRDYGRKLNAEEWARFTGRHECADEIAKFTTTKRFLFNRSSKKVHARSSSVPDLTTCDSEGNEVCKTPQRQKSKSFRRKLKKMIQGNSNSTSNSNLNSETNPFAIIARCVSTPLLPGALPNTKLSSNLKRPVSADCIPKVEITSAQEFLLT